METIAIWVEGVSNGPLAGCSGFLKSDEKLETFDEKSNAEFRIGQLEKLCLRKTATVTYKIRSVERSMAKGNTVALEDIKPHEMAPSFNPHYFKLVNNEYGTTGGHCMVSTTEFMLPELNKSVWVNIGEGAINITSVDYTWQNADEEGGYHEYEDVCLFEAYLSNEVNEQALPWFPMIQDALVETIKRETCFGRHTMSIPIWWLPEIVRQNTPSAYLNWLIMNRKDAAVQSDFTVMLDDEYRKGIQTLQDQQ